MKGLDRDRWDGLWRAAGATKDASSWFRRLTQLYAERHRHYHNAQHINECLHEFDSTRELTREPLAVELAIWFHDAIYKPRASDNEERSAELARRCLAENGLDERIQESVAQLVLATKHHDGSLHADAPLLVDIDLSILGQPSERFWEYEDAIRREYKWVPRFIFGPKRAEILDGFLARKRIYSTEHFLRKYEEQARVNLMASVQKLHGN